MAVKFLKNHQAPFSTKTFFAIFIYFIKLGRMFIIIRNVTIFTRKNIMMCETSKILKIEHQEIYILGLRHIINYINILIFIIFQ